MVQMQLRIEMDSASPMLVRIRQNVMDSARVSMRFGASAPYASYVEFGTRRMGARAFILPAYRALIDDLDEAYMGGVMMGNALGRVDRVGSQMEQLAKALCPVRTGFLQSSIYHEVH